MTGFTALLLLGAACWLVRVTFILLVPADRLPRRITSALGHVPPAVLAALVSVEAVDVVGASAPDLGLAALACVVVIGIVAYRRPSLTISAGLGLAAVLLVDVVLAA